MLLSTTTSVIWNSRNKNHYTSLGYKFTKMGDRFDVSVEDLTRGSQAIVDIQCDYCGLKYTIQWCTYYNIHKNEIIQKDACRNCCETKSSDTICKKYGSHSEMHRISDKKRKITNNELYGSPNVFGSKKIQNKIVETNMRKYGVPYTQQALSVRNKTMSTCMERYGVMNYIELFKGLFIGENSPVWKGGVNNSRVERATHEYVVWRKKVFERDKYTCVVCGSKTGNGHAVELHAHHIRNWADNPDMRYIVDNGVTMCDKCHYSFHSIYGKKNNTEEQFYDYMSYVKTDEKVC